VRTRELPFRRYKRKEHGPERIPKTAGKGKKTYVERGRKKQGQRVSPAWLFPHVLSPGMGVKRASFENAPLPLPSIKLVHFFCVLRFVFLDSLFFWFRGKVFLKYKLGAVPGKT